MPVARDLLVPGAHAGSSSRSAHAAPRFTGESAQSPADVEQSLAGDDQALSDADQTRSDSDQARADADQLASDRDQAISDRHLANGGDPVAHACSRDIRQCATRLRKQTSRARLLAATQRDESSHTRDLAGRLRDRAADRRDQATRREIRGDTAGRVSSGAYASWSIPAVAEEVAGARQAAVQFAHANGVPHALLEDLHLAISEAVTNAVVHAFRCRQQPGTITVSVDVRAHEIAEVTVRDDGMGMSQRSDSPGLGLGLGLIARVADQVEHRSPRDGTGCELWMCFRLDSPEHQRSAGSHRA